MTLPQPGDTKEMLANEKVDSVGMPAEAVDSDTDVDIQDIVLDTVNAKYTESDYKRVLQKIDRILLPLMWLCYGTQQADKTAISTQATFGMETDTGLVGQQFSCK
jgi:hypothetical protein